MVEKLKDKELGKNERPTLGNCEMEADKVGRRLPKCTGIYVQGKVFGTPVWCTVDTGASRTIISSRVYQKAKDMAGTEIQVRKQIPIEQADGNLLVNQGVVTVDIQLDNHLFREKEVVIANIKDDVLLGLDIGATVDVISSEGYVKIDGKTVSCTCISRQMVGKVSVADEYCIPGYAEKEIDVYISPASHEGRRNGEMILEPTENFAERYSLVMARSLVDLTNNVTGKVRILNPFDREVVLRLLLEDSVIGYAEPIDDEMEIVSCESEEMDEDQLSERRSKHSSAAREAAAGKNTSDRIRVSSNPGESAEKKGSHKDGDESHHNEETDIPEHLLTMYQKATERKTEEEKRIIRDIVVGFQDVFSTSEMDLGRTHLTVHEIPTGEARPVKQPPRRVPMALLHEEAAAVEDLKKQGVIRESSSPWASPIVLVKKKNGRIRPCVDYRRVNSLTTKDAYPIPRTQDCLDAMSGSIIFSTLDMTSGYHQIPIKQEDIPKTAFVTRQGLWEFTAMPFGLTNAPATFQRLMELVCKGLQWSSCLIYLDDVIIFGRTHQEHADRLQQVLCRIRQANLKLKPEKCELFQEEVRFLGHVVSASGIQPDPGNTSRIQEWPTPKTVTEVRQFLGLCSYYRRFVKNFSLVAKPLSDLTSKDSALVWGGACQKAFDELKAKLTSPGITAFPKDNGLYYLDTDASDMGIGAVLSQEQDGIERVIAYASRSMNRAERNYCVTDKELLAVRYFIEYFRQYLLGRHFCVRSDHQALRWLFQLKEPKGRIARWLERLSAYDFSIEYRPGRKHNNADGLSRCPNPRDCKCADMDNMESLRCGPCARCKKRSEEMYLRQNPPDKAQLARNLVAEESPEKQLEIERPVVGNSPSKQEEVPLAKYESNKQRETGHNGVWRSRFWVLYILFLSIARWVIPWRVIREDTRGHALQNFNLKHAGEQSYQDGSHQSDDGRLWPKLEKSSWHMGKAIRARRVANLDRGSANRSDRGSAKGPNSTHKKILQNYSPEDLKRYQLQDDRKWQDYVYIQCEYKSTKQKIKHLLREENKVKENKIS